MCFEVYGVCPVAHCQLLRPPGGTSPVESTATPPGEVGAALACVKLFGSVCVFSCLGSVLYKHFAVHEADKNASEQNKSDSRGDIQQAEAIICILGIEF